jgi:hypothetical protein
MIRETGVLLAYKAWGGSPAASAGVNIGITNAETILHLRGSGWAGGGGYGAGFGAGGELIWSKQYKGIEFSFGAGASYPLPVEGHIHRTYTSIFPVRSQTLTFEQIVGMAAAEAFYQSTTYGEASFMLHFMAITDGGCPTCRWNSSDRG